MASSHLRGLANRAVLKAESTIAASKGLALWLPVLLLAATVGVWLFDHGVRFDAPYLVLAANIVFIGVASIVIAVIAVRSFLHTGAWPVLWLGGGSLIFGLAAPLSSGLLSWSGANAAATTHNTGALLAASFHCLGAFFAANAIAPQAAGRRRSSVMQVYGTGLAAVAVVVLATVLGWMPPFFVQGTGGTSLRQAIVIAAALLFFAAGLALLRQYALSRAQPLYWYSLGLLLTSLGLAGVLMITAMGAPLAWAGRAAQWLGGVYLLCAAVVTFAEAKARHVPAHEVLAGYFLHREADLKLLFDSILDAIIITDRDFNISGWNQGAEAIYGFQADEVLGRPVAEVLGTEYVHEADLQKERADLIADGVSRTEVVQRHRSGRPVTILAFVSALKDDRGNMIGTVAVNRDITERRQAEEEIRRLNESLSRRAEELEASNRELEAFAYSVSHDLRAPLRGVDGFSQALQEDCADQLDETGQGYLRMLRLNAQRMGVLIDDLLALSRVGRQALQPQTVHLRGLVSRAWDELRPAWSGRAVEFQLAPLPAVQADATLLKQVYSNLFANALKFSRTRDPAIVEAGSEERGGEQVFFVRDNGVGFDMQYVDKVFGVFQRLHRAEEYEGTGVGLAIVQRIIHRHNGKVWAESRLGEGTTFYFTLGDGLSERTE